MEFRARTFEKSLLCSLRHFYARYDTFVPAGQKTIILVQFFGYKRGNRACITKTDILHLTIVVKSRDIQGVPFELTPPPPSLNFLSKCFDKNDLNKSCRGRWESTNRDLDLDLECHSEGQILSG